MRNRKAKSDPTPQTERSRILSRVAAWYRQGFLENPQAQACLKARGLTDETLWESFQVGYAAGTLASTVPAGNELYRDLQGLGVLDQEGKETLAGCVVFPWYGEGESCIGMMGVKVATGEEIYLAPAPEGVWNHAAAKRSRTLILTPSVLDAFLLFEAGFREVVPLWGPAGMTQDHRALFQRCGVKEITLTWEAGREVLLALQEEEIKTLVVKIPALPAPREILEPFLPKSATTQGLEGMVEREGNGFAIRYGNRWYRVKGIEKGPVKLKATVQVLKRGEERRFYLDSVDLYSHRGRQLFAKGVSGLLGAEDEEILGDLEKLLTMVERFEEKKTEPPKAPAMTGEEQAEALALLKEPGLLVRILEDFDRCGLSGEEGNKLVGYLAAVSRKLDEPLAVLIQSRSAAGKSTLQEAILRFVPPEDVEKYTRLTGQALFYKAEDGLCHKLLAIEEEAGARDASYSIRNLQSSRFLSIATTEKDPVTGKMRTMEYKVKGPVAFMLTTTAVDMDYETQNRFLTLTIDESKGMTERILKNQREGETLEGWKRRRERERIARRHQNAQRLLRPLAVVNPYAPQLAFPATTLRARRDHKKYLNLIKAIAFLHQYQREVKTHQEGAETLAYIEVEPSDVEKANALVGEVLGRTLDEVSAPGRALLGEIRRMSGKAPEKHFTRRQIREACGWSDFQVKTHLGELVELEYLYVAEGRKGKEYVYELAEEQEGPRLAGLVGVA